MVAYSNVAQGTGGSYLNPPLTWVGTDGLVTCLGIYVAIPNGIFVGHADCQPQVDGPGPEFDYVRDTLAEQMTAALGPYDATVHTALELFSGGTDPALDALRAGVGVWRGAPVALTGRDSFRVRTDGTGMTWVIGADVPTAVVGPDMLSVPNQALQAAG